VSLECGVDTGEGTAGRITVCWLRSVSRNYLRLASIYCLVLCFSCVNRKTQSTQKEEEGSKRRRRPGIGVRGDPVEGEREEWRKTTITSYELVTLTSYEQLIFHDHNDPTVSLPSFLSWVILQFFRKLKKDIFSQIHQFFDFFLFLRTLTRTLIMFWYVWCRRFQPATV